MCPGRPLSHIHTLAKGEYVIGSLSSWVRTITDHGLIPYVPPGACSGNRGVNPGVTAGFKAALTAVINVAVIPGLSSPIS